MPDTQQTPASAAEAEDIAKKFIGDYLSACRMQVEDREYIGNCLMKLCSLAGLIMAHAEGRDIAAARLRGTADYVARVGVGTPSNISRVQ